MSQARRRLRSLRAVLAGLLATVIPSLGSDAILQAAGLFTRLGRCQARGA